ncbi:apoptosis inhibitor 5 [Diabrotica virgifera virgifera]|uniref:Apoptosis inhibitor 5-like n=1 Tax=Diabrotica virgifera virgifera TaxID=50390 RepID=A0A6P7HJF3_DIAVI|nr:apoptosis inhibitor 5 [Diabrotica virgifera virgifera]
MADKLEELYQTYSRLSSAEDISKLSKEYLECISHREGSANEKKLVTQIIGQYFKHFPQQEDISVDALIDICEDNDPSTRISGIRVLPTICKQSKRLVHKIADILIQLMMVLEQQEFNVTCNSLSQVFRAYPEKTLNVLFVYIFKLNKPSAREDVVKYIYKKLVTLDPNITAICMDLLIEKGKKILEDSTVTEFLTVISFLTTTKLTQTTTGQQELLNAIEQRAKLDQEFDVEENNCHRLIICTEHALPLFSASVESTEFVKFYCQEVLSKWDALADIKDGEESVQPQLLQQLAALSAYCGKLETPSSYVVHIFDKLKRYMPLPPEDGNIDKMPNLDFTSVECLLYAFHRLARQSPDFLTADPAVLRDFKSRLTYFSRGVAGCLRSLEKLQEGEKKDDKKIKLAPVVLANINTLIKDLLHPTPIYKCNVQLSFRSATTSSKKEEEKPTTAQKRHTPIEFDSSNASNNKQMRTNKGSESMKLYSPPSGKFSNNFKSYNHPRGSGRGRGGRGRRGSSRDWKN